MVATPLNEFFPLVYEACSISTIKVENMGYWVDSCWHWDLGVADNAHHGEVGDELLVLVSTLRDVKPNFDEVVKVVWWRNNEGFSVKNSYKRLYDLKSQNLVLNEDSLIQLRWVWNANVPSKVKLFG